MMIGSEPVALMGTYTLVCSLTPSRIGTMASVVAKRVLSESGACARQAEGAAPTNIAGRQPTDTRCRMRKTQCGACSLDWHLSGIADSRLYHLLTPAIRAFFSPCTRR